MHSDVSCGFLSNTILLFKIVLQFAQQKLHLNETEGSEVVQNRLTNGAKNDMKRDATQLIGSSMSRLSESRLDEIMGDIDLIG